MTSAPEQRTRRPVAIDLFCGGGGLSQGFRDVGFRIALALDNDPDSCKTYAANHPETTVVCQSIVELSPDEIASRVGEEVDVVVGGPSCQGFSTARKQRWHDADSERNGLWRHMLAVVERLSPRAFLLENVLGMLLWKDGNFGAQILDEFRKLGYVVGDPEVLLAANYGVPQLRRRLFIVGLKGGSQFTYPEPTHMGGWRRDSHHVWEAKRMESGLLAHVPVWDAIGDLPPLMDAQLEGAPRYLPDRKTPFNRRMRKSVKNLSAHEFRPLTPAHQKLLRYVPQGGSWRDIPPHLLPDRFRGMRRTDSSNVLGRLDPARPSYTITTQFMNVTVGCFGHPFEDRGLSIREAARLQTFPDRYRFHGSFGSQAKQIGNAVPPLLASRLADAIAEQTGLRPAKQQPKPIKRSSKALPVPCRLGEEALLRLTTTGRLSSKDLVEAALLGVDESPAAREPNAPSWEPAFAFEPERLAIFVRECFLDGCEVHSPETASRLKWWKKRIEANVDANRRAEGELERTDWSWEVVWEHENPEHAALRIKGQVEQIRLDSDRPERFST